jgi:hypothetical protein
MQENPYEAGEKVGEVATGTVAAAATVKGVAELAKVGMKATVGTR